ncbi:MAG: ABC transporter permease [Mycobacteriaceae bacterium]|nr:ABC transporter permease [Mycobacteriaceae bacterium]
MPDSPRGQDRYVAPPDEVEVLETDRVIDRGAPRSLWAEAWQRLRRNPLFLVSAALIALILLVVAFPGWFAWENPRYCTTAFSMDSPRGGHPFGFDLQGCDVYARTIYGARASVFTGLGAAALFVVIGATVGALAGFFGGVVDAVISRLSEIVYAIPLLLGAIVLLQLMKQRSIWTVILILAAFTWPQAARITRAAVLEAKHSEYVTAAKALGVSPLRILVRHVLPNSVSPVIVVTTISLGVFIVTEATLSFLGLGLPTSTVSWGADIATGRLQLRAGSPLLFYPAGALAITVLSFILLGDAVRDALDPKARPR